MLFDGTKMAKFSSVEIEIAVAGPGNAKRKTCLSFPLELQT